MAQAKTVERKSATRKTTRAASTPKEVRSFDPATGELIGSVPVTTPAQVERIAEEVARIQAGWGLTPIVERLAVIRRAAEVLIRRGEEL
ncbi:MAG: aldehyde dehydrogenase family protein, partial [Actinomycetota bacterium]